MKHTSKSTPLQTKEKIGADNIDRLARIVGELDTMIPRSHGVADDATKMIEIIRKVYTYLYDRSNSRYDRDDIEVMIEYAINRFHTWKQAL